VDVPPEPPDSAAGVEVSSLPHAIAELRRKAPMKYATQEERRVVMVGMSPVRKDRGIDFRLWGLVRPSLRGEMSSS
jgi:hypothetical protein